VVGGEAPLQSLGPLPVAQDGEVLVGDVRAAGVDDTADLLALLRAGEPYAPGHALLHCGVAPCPAEDERDRWQQPGPVELLDDLGAQAGDDGLDDIGAATPRRGRPNWFWRGLTGNVLNPKVGAFYVSFLPLFVPAGVPIAPYTVLLAAIHVALGVAWFAALILATRTLSRALRRPRLRRTLDLLVGSIFIAMGLKLALSRE
jgi:hypothetical protein